MTGTWGVDALLWATEEGASPEAVPMDAGRSRVVDARARLMDLYGNIVAAGSMPSIMRCKRKRR